MEERHEQGDGEQPNCTEASDGHRPERYTGRPFAVNGGGPPARSRVTYRLSRSRRALIATITVDSDMSTAPVAGVRRMPTG